MAIDPKELLEQSQKIMGGVAYKSGTSQFIPTPAGQTYQDRLVAEMKDLAKKIPGAVILAPPGVKSFERAAPKVAEKYKGDWGEINDLNRCTLVVPGESGIESALSLVITHYKRARHSSPFQYLLDKCIRPNDPVNNPCAYSGYAVILRTPDLKRAEIQINYPDMMYAKSLPEFTEGFGEGALRAMRTKFTPVPGGLGHKMYEDWQKQKKTKVGEDNAAACKLYYEFFRASARTERQADEVLAAVGKLKLHVKGIIIPSPRAARLTG